MGPDTKTPNEQQQSQSNDNVGSSSASSGQNEQQAVKPKRPRGLAAADPETRRLVARKGGEAVSRNRKHMADIGKKGGEAVSQDRRHMATIGRKGGEAVSQNREHMAEIGRKGGESRGQRHHSVGNESQSLQSPGSSGQGGEANRELMSNSPEQGENENK